jgi:hypothetical protein
MATSGTYNFNDVQIDDIAREAYERIGQVSDVMDGLQIKSAETSLNFMLSQWVNQGLNLWLIEKIMMPCVVGQPSYSLPDATVDILELTAATILRLTNPQAAIVGNPFASSGVAANAFDNNPTTSCIQDAANGNIGFTFFVPTTVWYVGVQSNIAANYSLYIEYFDGSDWNIAYDTGTEVYQANQQLWFVLPTAYTAIGWRIREYGGATLNVQEVYFAKPNNSRTLSRISREQYINIPNKTAQAAASCWYIDRTRRPVLNLWPTPNANYPYLIFNRMVYAQDIGKLLNNVDAPQRFYEAIVSGLAAKLALKFAPDRYQMLAGLADEAYSRAAESDTEAVPLRIAPTFNNYT